ncbi:MAG: helix-turn-helix transcriptional regulator [Bacteroidales bacterium]|nr:helix-turn-helix transcriptional regulator [Bacteroidales bacterium]
MIDDRHIKSILRQRRLSLGITETEMARRLVIDRNTYYNIEQGKTRILHENLAAIARELGLAMEEVFLGYMPGDPDSDPLLQEKRQEYTDKVAAMAASYNRKIEEDAQRIRKLTRRVEELEASLRDKTELNTFLREKNEELEKIIRNA